MKAIQIQGKGHAALVTDAPLPQLPSQDWILVKVIAAALNPTDWKHIRHGEPGTPGCDFAGTVVEVGSNVKRPLKKGDRILGLVHGSNKLMPGNGAFAEYLVTKGDIVMHIPEHMSFEAAASMPVGILTCGQGLYQVLNLPWPDKPSKEKRQILIWGGSSATGALGIQFAKLSGFEVITTCSTSNFDYVKSLGADAVFDSRSPTAGADIHAYTKDKLYYAWDTIGEHGDPQGCADALASSAPEGQRLYYGTILANPETTKAPRPDAEFSWSLGYTAVGEAIDVMGYKLPGYPDHLEFAMKWTGLVENLLEEGKIKPHRQEVREGGLEGIMGGLEDLKDGKVSGVKLVYRIADP